MPRDNGHSMVGRMVLVVLAFLLSWPARAEPADPVEQLGQALRFPVNPANNPEALRRRRALLAKRAAALNRPGDLWRALALPGWTASNSSPDLRALAEFDQEVHARIGSRFTEAVRGVLRDEKHPDRWAIARGLGEMAAHAGAAPERARNAAVVALLATLAPELVALAGNPDERLAVAAIRSLGKMQADRTVVLPALERALGPEGKGARRRAAAAALAELVRRAAEADGKAMLVQAIPGREPDEAIRAGPSVVTAATPALGDADPEVCRLGLEVVREAARALFSAIPDPDPGVAYHLPPPGEPLTDADKKLVEPYRKEIEEERERLLPLTRALAKQIPGVARSLKDEHDAVCIAAGGALEDLAAARQRLLARAASVPPVGKGAAKFEDPLATLREAVSGLAGLTTRKEVRVRMAGLYALETLGADAAPAAEATAKAMRDENPFVRWGAARVAGKIAPHDAGRVVPALALLLKDNSKDVRLSAAAALERYGPAAREAVPALGMAAGKGDARTRIAAMRALGRTGTDAREAVAALAAALADPNADIRLTAAQILYGFGRRGRAAAGALHKVLDDADPRVRVAASEAL